MKARKSTSGHGPPPSASNMEKTVKHFSKFAVAGLLAVATLTPAAAADISGAGASFPYPVYTKWADAYKKATGIGLNY
jgi:phosphate transport system substrate-binding protein